MIIDDEHCRAHGVIVADVTARDIVAGTNDSRRLRVHGNGYSAQTAAVMKLRLNGAFAYNHENCNSSGTACVVGVWQM